MFYVAVYYSSEWDTLPDLPPVQDLDANKDNKDADRVNDSDNADLVTEGEERKFFLNFSSRIYY